MHDVKLVTAFINPEMYGRFFTANATVLHHDLIGIDNRPLNRGLPTIYNEVIANHIDDNCWLFFVHEDFEIKSGMDVVESLDRDFVYGSFGINLENNVPVAYGRHTCSDKDGSSAVQVGNVVREPAPVQTLDCQGVLVHTSLLAKHPRLRFDEALTFDLYAEDFCINARERHGIDAKVFPLEFQHYSHGNITERYHAGLRYLAAKYPAVAVAGSCSFIGGRACDLEKHFQYNIRANGQDAPAGRIPRLVGRLARRVKSSILARFK